MDLYTDFKLKDRTEIEGTGWIEFNISGSPDKYIHHSDDSIFLDEYAYNLFTDIFQKYANNFNYYGPTSFSIKQLEKIKYDIEKRSSDLSKLTTLKDLINFSDEKIKAMNLANELRDNYGQLITQIDKIINDINILTQKLIYFLNNCITENKTLWILGL